ncbi:translation elongation factor Ts [bacterium]|nr:translation elongation factor Ts [bacterium]NCP08485.1 translation elongation factor Ts [bacterium]OIP42431.1 MAG: translation elongation factor Ts [Desulfobacteraceae bacterium CG2_30_51_40]
MEISAALIKQLREKTGVGIMDCKEALANTGGDLDKSVDYLRKKGIATAQKRSARVTSQGQIQSYIHAGGKIGVLVEVNCETDFSARTADFSTFIKDLAMQIAASSPISVDKEGIPPQVLEREKEIYATQAKESGKPEKVIEKMVEGKMSKFYTEACLMEQPFVKNPDIKIKDLLNDIMAKTGEKIIIRRFVRYQLGESNDK